MTRQIKFKDMELAKLLEDRNKIVLQGRKDDTKRQQLEERLKKSALELQKIDGKAGEILKTKEIDLKVDPDKKIFEQVMGAKLEGGKIVIDIEDRVETFISALKAQIKKLEEPKPVEENKE